MVVVMDRAAVFSLWTGAVKLSDIHLTYRTVARQRGPERTIICSLLSLLGPTGELTDEPEPPVRTRIQETSEDGIANRRRRITPLNTHAAHMLQDVWGGYPEDMYRDRIGRFSCGFDHAGNHTAISTQVFDHAANPDHVWGEVPQLRNYQEQFIRITCLRH